MLRRRCGSSPGQGSSTKLSAPSTSGCPALKEPAQADAQEALRLEPREGEFHNTVGAIYQRMHRFEEAAAAFANYVNLLPERDRNDRALWARETIRFLHSFDNRTPLDFGAGAE